MKLNAVAYRRGSAVHTYLFNAGTTLQGKNMMHDMADVDDDEVLMNGRPCPRVLNDFTQGQPWTDVGNKIGQHELGMEYRFPTTHFPNRLFTTMWGIVLVSAFQAFKYFWP
mmetsp:Transcript_79204/g.157487  ORF Transcript_79204/g.157487 Transcript_79204/m.157487 type:complete len:111 (-) Transcript_79204:719-1051(-)